MELLPPVAHDQIVELREAHSGARCSCTRQVNASSSSFLVTTTKVSVVVLNITKAVWVPRFMRQP